MAAAARSISHTTLHEAASGTRFPSWETTREFVRVCSGDEVTWRARWEAARAAVDSGDPSVPPVAEPGGRAADGAWSGSGAGRRQPARRGSAVTLGAFALAGTLGVLALAVTLVAVALLLVAWPDRQPTGPPTGSAESAGTAAPGGPLVAGDQSRFVADVTVPDGTRVRPGETFVKTWEIQNVGTVRWRNRFLQREDVPARPGNCQTPDRIPIDDTSPDERVRVSVTVLAPAVPTTCLVRWKMVDELGRYLFPAARPVFFLVHVEAAHPSGPA